MITADDVVRFRPRHGALGALADAKGSASLLPQLVAVAAGIRPAADDWVPTARLDAYTTAARELGLVVERDVTFEPIESTTALGASRLTTTRARGAMREGTASSRSTIHVFVARDRGSARAAQAAGWYPLVAEGAVVPAAWCDAVRFGRSLGYPTCCIESFIENNRWDEVGHVQRLGAPGGLEPTRNFLPRHLGYAWTFHIPCSWRCGATLDQATAARAALGRLDPEYAALVDIVSAVPVVVWSERTIYLLFRSPDGRLAPLFAGGSPTDDSHSAMLASGDAVLVDGDMVAITLEGRTVGLLSPRSAAPVLLEFDTP